MKGRRMARTLTNTPNNTEVNPETNPIINLSKTSFGSLAYKTGIINKTDNLYLKLNEENYSKY